MDEIICFKKGKLCKVMCSYAVKVLVADRKFFAVLCLGLGLTSQHKCKSHLNHG